MFELLLWTHTKYPAHHALHNFISVNKWHSPLLISIEARAGSNHSCGGDSTLEGTSTQFPAQCLERLLGQAVLSWPNRSHPVVGDHPFRALCSCPVPHTSASRVWKGQHSPLLCCHANITLLINYKVSQRIDLFFRTNVGMEHTEENKPVKILISHVFSWVTIHMGCLVYCDCECHL